MVYILLLVINSCPYDLSTKAFFQNRVYFSFILEINFQEVLFEKKKEHNPSELSKNFLFKILGLVLFEAWAAGMSSWPQKLEDWKKI